MESFVRLLETEGGKILVIVGMLVFIIGACLTMILTGHPLQETGKEMAVGAVSSLLGILYGYLRASGPAPPVPPVPPVPPTPKEGKVS